MKEDDQTWLLAKEIILKAIENKTPCYITVNVQGVTLMSYQDKLGYKQRLELYYQHTDGREFKPMILSIVGDYRVPPKVDEKRVECDQGCLIIDPKELLTCSISTQSDGRQLLNFGYLKINFLR